MDDLIKDLKKIDPRYKSHIKIFSNKYYCEIRCNNYSDYDIVFTKDLKININIPYSSNGFKDSYIYISPQNKIDIENYLIKTLRDKKIIKILNDR